MPPSPRIENQNAGLRSPRWRTTFSGRIGAIEVDAGLRSDRNKYRRRGHPLSGSRDRIRTAQSPSWGGRGRHRAILPGADEGRHGGEQARRAQLDSLRRSGERIVELINAIRGDRDLILNPLTAQKPILPVTVVPHVYNCCVAPSPSRSTVPGGVSDVFEDESWMDCNSRVVPQPSMLNTSNAQANAAKRV